jgi:hypothetical protein
MCSRVPIPTEIAGKIPGRIVERLNSLDSEVGSIVAEADAKMTTQFPPRVAFEFSSSVLGRDMLSDYERAQSVSFVTRYEHLPEQLHAQLVSDDNGKWHIANLWELRHVLNDFRPIIQNQSDSVYYQKVHSVWFQMLRRADPSEGMTIRVRDDADQDVTDTYSSCLGERNRAVRHIIGALDFDYLYNGFLQHSDERFSKRLFQDYMSGELNSLIWKHVRPLARIRSLLQPYYVLIRVLTFPSLGPL